MALIARMPKPEEVLILVSESGEITREKMPGKERDRDREIEIDRDRER